MLRGWSPLIALQIEYSLLQRTVEGELVPMAEELGLGVTPWGPLRGGALSGKYRRADRGQHQAGRGARVTNYLNDATFDLLEAMETIATSLGTTVARVALAWVQGRPGVTSTIIGARTSEQLDDNLGALDVELTPEHVKTLDDLSKPALPFPTDMLSAVPTFAFGGTTINGTPSQLWPQGPRRTTASGSERSRRQAVIRLADGAHPPVRLVDARTRPPCSVRTKEPDMDLTDIAMVGLTLGMLALLGAGVAHGSRRAAIGVVGAVSLWLLVTAALAERGVFSAWTARPPRLLLVPATTLGAIIAVNRTEALRALLASTPRWWPIAAQSFRVGVELALSGLYAAGRAPVQVTFEGRNADILVGLTAPVVAWVVARRGAPRLALAWNVAGLGVLLQTIAVVLSSVPGPLHRGWPGEPFTAPALWPVIWLPGFLAPLAIFLHIVSIRQAVAAMRGSDAGR